MRQYTGETSMVSISKVIGIMSGSFVLCLGLSTTTPAIDTLTEELEELEKMETSEPLKGTHTIKGEVLHVERDNYLVKQSDGRQVRLQIDESTQMTGNISQGERIEARVYDEHHALSIRQAE
jgi:hypothetical protein